MMKHTDLYQEYNALLLQSRDYLEKLGSLKDGYVSAKTIAGKKYFYLQKRVGDKVNSEYIKEGTLEQTQTELRQRNEIEQSLITVNEQLDRLENAAKLLDKSLYRRLFTLRGCVAMDTMPVVTRKKALQFGKAMAALENAPTSAETQENLSLWATGQGSFQDSYLQTLIKYHLAEEVQP